MKRKTAAFLRCLARLSGGGGAVRSTAALALLFGVVALSCMAPALQAESPRLPGIWKIEIAFTNGESRSLRFDAQRDGTGSFSTLDPRTVVEGAGKPSEGKWTEGAASSVAFSGPFSFPLGNVGRDPGTLVFKGKFEGENTVTGQVNFAPIAGRPSKNGPFKAIRVMP